MLRETNACFTQHFSKIAVLGSHRPRPDFRPGSPMKIFQKWRPRTFPSVSNWKWTRYEIEIKL